MCRQNVWFSYWIIILLPLTTSMMPVERPWYKPWCILMECCTKEWIPQDYEAVRKSLGENLFGQHLVHHVVYTSLKGHVTFPPVKPLVLSFHGSVGTGKTYVSKWIAKGWFREGMKSKFVHMFSASKDFPHKSEMKKYVDLLRSKISAATSSCRYQIFIFEEADSFPPDLLRSLRHFLEYYEPTHGVDYRNTIFVFLSNAGQEALNNIAENVYTYKGKRESILLPEAERSLVLDIYSTSKGTSHTRLVDKHLVSHFVPFFPLERSHVRDCILVEMDKTASFGSHRRLVEDVLNELQFNGPEDIFSSYGCKKVSEKVKYVISSALSSQVSVREDL